MYIFVKKLSFYKYISLYIKNSFLTVPSFYTTYVYIYIYIYNKAFLLKKCQAVISVKPNSADLSRAKLFIDYFSWTCELFKNAKKDLACAIRDCLGVSLTGVSRPFVSDTSPKCIDREGLERCRIGTREEVDQELWRTLEQDCLY